MLEVGIESIAKDPFDWVEETHDCGQCGETKPIEEFYITSGGGHWTDSAGQERKLMCKKCEQERLYIEGFAARYYANSSHGPDTFWHNDFTADMRKDAKLKMHEILVGAEVFTVEKTLTAFGKSLARGRPAGKVYPDVLPYIEKYIGTAEIVPLITSSPTIRKPRKRDWEPTTHRMLSDFKASVTEPRFTKEGKYVNRGPRIVPTTQRDSVTQEMAKWMALKLYTNCPVSNLPGAICDGCHIRAGEEYRKEPGNIFLFGPTIHRLYDHGAFTVTLYGELLYDDPAIEQWLINTQIEVFAEQAEWLQWHMEYHGYA